MAGPKIAAFRGVQDCKVAAITVDTTAALTYGTLYDVPIQNFSCTANIETYTLKHDDIEQEIDQQTQSYDISFSMGRVPFDVLNIFTGGSVSATGAGTTEVQTYSHEYDDDPNYFKLETQHNRAFATDGTAGDVHIVFYKCKVLTLEISVDNDFASVNVTAKAIRTINTGKIKNIVVNETAAAIA